ncbi:LacI family transcriptional regulator [Labrenzia sp. EL_208]|uniref:Putative galacturonate locus repressor n=1 Tax=Roseibium album TaxID=311410 RepID=A0A0M6ZXP6_9HYPH|nr:LacI family DNA-binding transcriptional regulator [Roseibium album]MBG6142660.1 LacI family transcriptional regulator [Labrenzia sp. EL_142]MBG6177671.1 LacI family transcriptional regulator [Labrenzia sp. EL_132]MBG6232249.1 LacI family transcriptional regulator [Labrenzia sp. EL_208]CTQ58008.1 putative galacturonate locus repressor [Roseibium album]CTQ67558.1 putative galacturonate locus repressor [Roseibium album]
MGEKITSYMVAKRAGVSQSAVSRVFKPGSSVSEKTARKVRKAAEELGYRPNTLARAMASGRSRIIGLVVAYFENQFYPEAIEKLANTLQANDYHVLMFMSWDETEAPETVINDLLDYQVDGIIAASVGVTDVLTKRCEAAGIPVMLFNRHQNDDKLSAVTSDNFTGGRKLAEFLVRGGHERIAHVAGWDGASTQRDREAGFLSGLAAHGMTLFARSCGNFHRDQAQEAARVLLRAEVRPDAIFVSNDHMAFAVMDVIRSEFKLRIPEDISIVGYDDVAMSEWPCFDLTTVRQPTNRMAEETVRILLQMIENEESLPCRIALDGPLVVRGSARLPVDE